MMGHCNFSVIHVSFRIFIFILSMFGKKQDDTNGLALACIRREK